MSKTVKDIKADETVALGMVPAPAMPYSPTMPRTYSPNIALVGCGGIAASHLSAYRSAGFKIAALCDLIEERAVSRRDEYFPQATTTTDYREIMARSDIDVVDIATHPVDRVEIIEAAILAKKHVLSQKPFVLDLATGERFVQLAKDQGVVLAVNQNARWAPHFSYMREAVRAGLVGDVLGVHAAVHWDHTWTKGTPFEDIEDLVLYDFGIHWFDFVASILKGRKVLRVFATKGRALGRDIKVPMLAQCVIEFDGGQASLVFDGHTRFGSQSDTYITGTIGSITSSGPNIDQQTVHVYRNLEVSSPRLAGSWFTEGFQGSMGELLAAIEDKRTPLNNAADNLESLALAFATISSANDGCPYDIGQVTRLWTPETARQ